MPESQNMTTGSRVYLYHGTDNYSMWQSIERVKQELSLETGGEVKTERIRGEETTALKLIETCGAADLFSSSRLIIVEGFLSHLDSYIRDSALAGVKAGEKKKRKSETDSFSQLVSFLKQGLPPGVSIVFIETDPRKGKNPFFTQLSTVAKATPFTTLKWEDLRKWVIDKVKERGTKISPAATNLLMTLVGGNLFALSQEIEKLVLFTGGKTIEEEDIKHVTSYAREPTIFNLVDSIIEKNKAGSQNYLHQLLAEGEEPGHIVGMLTRQLSFLVRTRNLLDKKILLPEIQKKIGLTGFQWDKLVTQARGCPMPKLVKFYDILLNYDLSMKKGLLPKDLALELLVSELWFVS